MHAIKANKKTRKACKKMKACKARKKMRGT